jgi:hypothetical protein
MKIEEFKIELDSVVYFAGEKITGRLIIRSNDQHLDKNANACVKFYDKLEIEWLENEIISFDSMKRGYANRKKPFEINHEVFFDRQHVFILYDDDKQRVSEDSDDNNETHYTFAYPFEFQLPSRLQGTINIPNAKCNYYMKAYLTDDAAVSQHFQKSINALSAFIKTLRHTYCKQHVIIFNRVNIPNEIVNQKHVYEANSPNMHVVVTLPKLVYSKGELVIFHINIANRDRSKEKFEVHKLAIKLNQMVKLTSDEPYEKVRLFDNLISHKSRKSLAQNCGNCITIDESIEIPKDVPCTSTRTVNLEKIRHEDDETGTGDNHPERQRSFIKKFLNPIRVNYKLNLEFWKNFLVDELDIKIPLLVDPEE